MGKFENLVEYHLIIKVRVTSDVSSFRTNIDLIYQGKLDQKDNIK